MSESNSQWGQLQEHDPSAADAWDSYPRLPEPGNNEVLDSFCRRKNLSIGSLVRLGAKMPEPHIICYAYDEGLKYRDLNDGRKWARVGSRFPGLKIIPTGEDRTGTVLVVEGETDAARVSDIYPFDIAVLPRGARAISPAYIEQLTAYKRVLVGLDDDEAGTDGAEKIKAGIPWALIFRPDTGTDWCATLDADLPTLEDIPEAEVVEGLVTPDLTIVTAGDLLTLEVPEITSWLEGGVLPVGGSLALHGWAKSFKSFIAFDMLASLSQGEGWCHFGASEEACKVCIIQYEIPWAYYRERVVAMREIAKDTALFDANYYTYTPLSRPQLIAGNVAQEDEMIRNLTDASIQVVLFDPLRRMAGHADLNAENEVRKLLGFFERLNDEGITVVYTHHDSKDSARSRGGDPLGMTGSGAFAGDPDTIVSVALPRGEKYNESVIRDLHFTLRNAPTTGARGMRLSDNGNVEYLEEPHVTEDDDETEGESHLPPL